MPSNSGKKNAILSSRGMNRCGIWKKRTPSKPVALSYLEFTLSDEETDDLSLDFSCLSVEKSSLRPLLELPAPSPVVSEESSGKLSASTPLPETEPLASALEEKTSSSLSKQKRPRSNSFRGVLSVINSDPRVFHARSPAHILVTKRCSKVLTPRVKLSCPREHRIRAIKALL